jgi:2-methylfumaryl-CoA hydratase
MITTTMMTTRTNGNFFEDFSVGQHFVHAQDVAVTAQQVAENARLTGLKTTTALVDNVLVFNLVFGLSVADISLNAAANLGYADGRFGVDVLAGDRLSVRSEVIGLRQVSSGKAGVVYVTTTAHNQRAEEVLRYTRWVLVNKRDPASPAPAPVVPTLPVLSASAITNLTIHPASHCITEADHQAATRLWHNPARLHFDPAASPYGQCLVYGGYIIALAHALSGAAGRIKTIYGGAHHHPVFAGDDIFAATTMHANGSRTLWALKNSPFATAPNPTDPDVVLEWLTGC